MAKSFVGMITAALVVTGLAACMSLQSAQSQTRKELKIPALAYEKYHLPNGLEIILYENHRLPLVAVDVWYHVGPINEVRGRTGFAHLFEHMMFQGSEHVGEKVHFRYLEGAGASDINGTTDLDRTNYFETLPSNQLGLALWLESDRMGFLLEKLDRTKLANQRDVVRNERRESVEGRPYGLSEEQMYHLLFPAGHPYYAAVIGSHEDIEAARIADVRDFFHRYYAPNNATIAIAGDFDSVKIKPLLDRYFGPIPSGPPIDKVNVIMQPLTREMRAVVTDTVQLSRVSVGWLMPRAFQPGDAEADLTLQILGGGKSSRLYRKLVYEAQIAQTVECQYQSLALASVGVCDVTARPGVSPQQLEAAINKEIDGLRAAGPAQAELDRARNMILTKKITGLQRLGGFDGVADMMNLYNQYVGDPGYLPKDVERYETATVASVQTAARRFLGRNQRAVVYTVTGKKAVDDVPRSPADTDSNVKLTNPYPASFEAQQAWRNDVPTPAPAPQLHLPVPAMFTLSNGMKVYLIEDHSLPLIHADILNLAGSEANPPGKPGIAGFAARMLTQGTKRRSAIQIADDSDQIGGELKCEANDDAAVANMGSLSNHAEAVLDLISDVVENPTFQGAEIERIRREQLAAIMQEADDPFQTFLRVGRRALYGEGPYGYPPTGASDEVKAITRQDLADFWAAHYAPQQAALVLAGDLTVREAHRLAEVYFGSWSASSAAKLAQTPQTPDLPQRHIVIVDRPGAPQTALGAFGIGLSRNTPDYAAVQVMNGILGGLFSSRINMNLRERHGFTYGAFSDYMFRRGAGPFLAGAMVRTDVTGPAARELFIELKRIRTELPAAAELKLAKDYALHSLPGQFETVKDTSDLMRDLFVYNLPVDYYRRLPDQYSAVTVQAVQKAAVDHVQPNNLIIVAVGDRAKIEGPLREARLGPTELRDGSGKALKAALPAGSAGQLDR